MFYCNNAEKIDEPVGLIVEDECLAVAAILGALKAGKFYVPLDRSLPFARLSSLVDDCGIRVFVTESKDRDWLLELVGGRTVRTVEDFDAILTRELLISVSRLMALPLCFTHPVRQVNRKASFKRIGPCFIQ